MKLRGVVSDKERLVITLDEAYMKASSEKDFYLLVENEGFEIYYRGGKESGVVQKRRYRFRTLGYNKGVLMALDKSHSRKKRLETIFRIRQYQQHKKGRQR